MLAWIPRRPVLVLLLSAASLASCGGKSPTQPTHDWIELKSIQPAENTVFARGDTVTFNATVECTVASSDGGTVVLIVQSGPVINQPTPVTLPKGTTTVTLTSSLTMPDSEMPITVFIPLFVNGSNETAMMKRLNYTVK